MRFVMLLVPALWLSVAAAQPAPLRLLSTAWPRFTNPPRQPRFALDLVEDALRRSSLTARTTIVSAAQFTPSLLSGLFDGSGALWKDAERERSLVFSRPYLENRLVLVGRRGADVSARTLADLKGTRIAIVEGYAYGDTIDQAGPAWVRSRSQEDSLTQLLKSAVDYTLMDQLVVHYILENHPKESSTRLEIGQTALVTRELHLAINRSRADAASIVERFDAEIRRMIADRTYHRMLHLDWIRVDIDGDGVPEYVPASDRLGSAEPQHVYPVFTSTAVVPDQPGKTGFYVGGNIYSDWTSVPDHFKIVSGDRPNPSRSTGTIFRFTW
jgi:polar amino acid transport system substrate-binding protein